MCVEIIKKTSYRDCFEKIIELKGKSMTEAMESYYSELSYVFPSFFACSTGFGKSFFALRFLFKILYESSDLILYLSNRSATDLQAKKIYIKEMGFDYLLERNTDEGLKDLDRIGNAYFLTYQKLYEIIINPIKSKDDILSTYFRMVYCDESQFFTSDSSYNYSTSATLSFIVNFFQTSIKVYNSATPDPAFTQIYLRELRCFKKNKSRRRVYRCQDCEYTKLKSKIICKGDICLIENCNSYITNCRENEFEPILYEYFKNYDYVDFYVVNSTEEFVNYQNDKDADEKTIIFVETKNVGKNIHNFIQNSNNDSNDSVYINAANKNSKGKPGNSFRNLIAFETIDEVYGIFTSCLDAGINYVDDSLKNIVFSTIDKNQAIQMTGRKRLKDGERVNFIIVNKTEDELKKSLSAIERQLEAIAAYKWDKKKFKKDYFNGSQAKYNFSSIHGIFYINDDIDDCKLRYNDLAEVQLNYLKDSVVEILDKIGDGDELAYVKTVMSWFGRNDYNDDMWIKYKPKEEYRNELVEFLYNKVGRIGRNEYEDFRDNFFNKFIDAHGLNDNESKNEIFAIKKINKKFIDYKLQYELISIKEDYYRLEKLNEPEKFDNINKYLNDLIEYLDSKIGDIEQHEYENFVIDLVEKFVHAFIESKDIEINKKVSINKINILFKEHGLMYELSKHSGTCYDLIEINHDEEVKAL